MGVLSPLAQRCELKAKTKSKKVNKTWLNDHVNDTYVKLAQKDGYRARAAASGALNGTIIGLDILPMEPVEDVTFIQGDFREEEVLAQLETALQGRVVDVVVSDMAPNLTGIESTDATRIAHLIELAVDFAQKHLKDEGALVVKLFHGSGYSDLVNLFKTTFRVVKPVKPKASRDKSSETFLVGIGVKSRVLANP